MTSQKTKKDIKTCPFCGDKPKINHSEKAAIDMGFSYDEASLTVVIFCNKCGIHFSDRKGYGAGSPNVSDLEMLQSRLIERWNTRK